MLSSPLLLIGSSSFCSSLGQMNIAVHLSEGEGGDIMDSWNIVTSHSKLFTHLLVQIKFTQRKAL